MSLTYLSGVADIGRLRKKKRKFKLFRKRKKVDQDQAPEQTAEQAPEQEESLNDMRVKKEKVRRKIKQQNEEPDQEQEQEQEQEPEQQESESNDSIGIIYPGMPTPLNYLRNRRLRKFPKKRKRILNAKTQNLVNKPLHKYRTLKNATARRFNPKSTVQYYIHKGLPLRKNLIHPQLHQIGRTKGKLKKRLQARFKKIIDRRKNDKHTRKEKIAHFFAKQALILPRGAFLAILLLGKALQHTPIKINLGKKMKQAWGSQGKKFEELWYKLGGEPDILKKRVEKATNSKLSGNLGVVATAGAAAAIASATPVIVKVLKLFGKAKDFAEKNPKLVALGQGLVKKGIDKVAKKNGKVASTYSEAIALADTITSALPPETQKKINKIRKKLPSKLVDSLADKTIADIKQVTTASGANEDIKQTADTTADSQPTKNKTLLYVGLGATALVGAYLLTKKK